MIVPADWTGTLGLDPTTIERELRALRPAPTEAQIAARMAQVAALKDLRVTAPEIAGALQWRGQYRPGQDTRDFVVQQETACEAYNCWMVRDAQGAPVYVSEKPNGP